MHRRERLLRAVGATDLTEYRARPHSAPLPRLVVVIDEFAALAKDLPDFLAALVGVAQRGRSLGIHLVLATQRPAGVVNDDIRANTNLRIALRLTDAADARDVVDAEAPASFPRAVPGRAALRLGPGELVTFQAASCTGALERATGRLRVIGPALPDDGHLASAAAGRDAPPSQLVAAVAVVADAVRVAGLEPPHRPWIDPLPESLTMDDVAKMAPEACDDVIGLVDDPAAQCRRPLRWDTGRGNLALLGALGTGTTSALVALLAGRCRSRPPDRLHCYVIDARGDAALDPLAAVAHCGGVIRVGDAERLHRLLCRLDAQITERAAGPAAENADVLLAIDGLGSLRSALAAADRAPTLTLLDRVVEDGPAAGVVSCWSDHSAGIGASAHAADTWSFGDDGTAAAPGRLRIASSGLIAHVARDAGCVDGIAGRGAAPGPPAIERLPARVRAATVLAERPPENAASSATLELPVGVADDGLDIAKLRVPASDHVFVGGGALTGKTTTLLQLSQAWRRLHPTGTVLFVARQDPLTPGRLEASASGPVLVVVDDADRVDDVGGVLASILAGEFGGATIIAAARLDAVRAAYGHWTRDVARSRCGVILTSAGEVDGDLLGVMLPRRPLIPPRPGLGWMIDGRGHRLVQVAQADVEFVGSAG